MRDTCQLFENEWVFLRVEFLGGVQGFKHYNSRLIGKDMLYNLASENFRFIRRTYILHLSYLLPLSPFGLFYCISFPAPFFSSSLLFFLSSLLPSSFPLFFSSCLLLVFVSSLYWRKGHLHICLLLCLKASHPAEFLALHSV